MKERFQGEDGLRRLVQVIREQKLVEYDAEIASAIAGAGELIEFEAGTVIVQQGGSDNAIYFLIDGEVSVEVKGCQVASRGPGDSIGEMALLSASVRRSASVKATRNVLALKLSEPAFLKIAERQNRRLGGERS